MKTREVMIEMEKKSDYIRNILQKAEENEGEPIKDTLSIESKIYYCYRHIYNGFVEENGYDFLTYEDGEYTYKEIYDYYYGANANADKNDDAFVYEFEKWFENEENISYYRDVNCASLPPNINYTPLPPLYDYYELKARVDFHATEVAKYTDLMDELYPE